MKKQDTIRPEEIEALIERAEARSLKEGDGQIIAEVIKKMVEIERLFKEGKITSRGEFRRLMAIPRPKPSIENKADE
jgi:hypothetical protein